MMSSVRDFDVRNPLQLKANYSSDEDRQTEEGVLLEQDIEGAKRHPKRNAVKLDYDSDSSDDNSSWKNKKKKKDEDQGKDDDEDMFGESDKEEENQKAGDDNVQKDKQTKLLDMNDFEKTSGIQQHNEERNDEGNEDSEDEDLEEVTESNVDIDYYSKPDEEVLENSKNRTKSARREPKIEKFNLRDDLEEGAFDEEGNYIRRAVDEYAHQDEWLADLSKKEINRALKAHLQREREEEENAKGFIPNSDMITKLIDCLEVGESPLEALQRLNSKVQKKKNNSRSQNKPIANEMRAEELERKNAIEQITESADGLLQSGINNIYDLTREELSRMYQQETGDIYKGLKRKRSPSLDLPTKGDSTEWEFRWEGSDEIHGPYPQDHMVDWALNKFFDERMLYRKLGSTEFLQYNNSATFS